MNRTDSFKLFLWALAAFCAFGIFMSIRQSNTFERECEARGGVPVMAKHANTCLDPKALR